MTPSWQYYPIVPSTIHNRKLKRQKKGPEFLLGLTQCGVHKICANDFFCMGQCIILFVYLPSCQSLQAFFQPTRFCTIEFQLHGIETRHSTAFL